MNGTWTTTGSTVTISAGGVLALAGAGYALTHPKQVAADLSGAVTVAAVVVGVVLAAAVTFIVLRLRNGRRTAAQPRQAAEFWKVNPEAIPYLPRREIAAPVVTVNIDATLLAGLMAAMQQQAQPAPVIVPSEREELPR